MTQEQPAVTRWHSETIDELRLLLGSPSSSVEIHDNPSYPHPLSKRISPRHWVVLILACLLMFGSSYCYELPAAINTHLNQRLGGDYELWQYQFNLLFTVASLPNLVLPLLGGVAIDRFGSDAMLCVLTVFVCLGQAIFALGVSLPSFPVMLAGRLVFGIGGPSLEVAQGKVITDWFSNRALAFAMGIALTFNRIATATNYIISPWLYTLVGEVGVCWVGFGLCIASAVCMLVTLKLDRARSRIEVGVVVDSAFGADEKFEWNELGRFSLSFWLLCCVCVALYGAIQPFMHISSDFLQYKWYHNDTQTAGAVQSIPDLLSSVFSPLCGILIDQHGYRGTILPFSGVTITFSHLLLGLTTLTPVLPLVILGFAYSFFAAALWPCIPVLVRQNQLGTAYGLATVALNLALTGFPVVVAWLSTRDEDNDTGDWVAVEIGFAGLAAIGTTIAVVLCAMDWGNGGRLDKVGCEEEECEDATTVVAEGFDGWAVNYHGQGARTYGSS